MVSFRSLSFTAIVVLAILGLLMEQGLSRVEERITQCKRKIDELKQAPQRTLTITENILLNKMELELPSLQQTYESRQKTSNTLRLQLAQLQRPVA
ncbi:hypothetical protein BDF22DRAFT_685191 [Syncephalis plumigaleata]|nr:hypothetical protein BDF22DRAFT_685191 [Syncephalis plumigaleata]